MSGAKTGIRLRMALPRSSRMVGQVLHFLHLDRLGQMAASANHLHVMLDGAESDHDIGVPHLFECAPGEHELKVALVGFLPGAKTLDPIYYTATLQVPVSEGQVAKVVYTPQTISHGTGNATIEVETSPG